MTAAKKDIDHSALHWLQSWIQEHTGVVFPEHKLHLLEQRLATLCIRQGFPNANAIIQQLQHNSSPELAQHVIDIATTNHTHFFRETEAIHYFMDEIIPTYPAHETLRVWSAASSSGEEMYTICLMLMTKYPLSQITKKFSFLGTDVNPKVIQQAEQGLYSTQRIQGIPSHLQKEWFTPSGLDTWLISDKIKALCLFRRLNLLHHPWPFTHSFHVIFLRNVLYYFDASTQENILHNMYEKTLPGGWLITSVTESFQNISVEWTRVKAGIYRKMQEAR